ncbi:cation-transporting P-type ATPase [Thalassobacillus sp. C254]|uniref:cation-transporting P-type ATPase n=1 Tax=Thalassobacillus sp. C254 TaxID=1225341 RepID=UPI00277D1555|nr:cation-transporting P-type ATPase [Thalassobacillus sp. C254]
MEEQYRTQRWHDKHVNRVLQDLDTDITEGLSKAEVEVRKETYGSNELPAGKQESLFKKFAKQFNDILIYILLTAAVVTLVLGHYIDTAVIVMVAVINAVSATFRRAKPKKPFKEFETCSH